TSRTPERRRPARRRAVDQFAQWPCRERQPAAVEGVILVLTPRSPPDPGPNPESWASTAAQRRETEGEGFEPSSDQSGLKRFSRPPHSTALPPLQGDASKA